MASTIITLNVKWELVSETPDGTQCEICECKCYLHQWRIFLFVQADKVFQEPVLTHYVFCDSCKSVVEEGIEE